MNKLLLFICAFFVFNFANAQKWVEVEIPQIVETFDMHFMDSDNGIITGWDGAMIITNDAGNSWTEIDIGSGITQYIPNLHMIDLNTGYAIGNTGELMKTTNGGYDWTQMNSGTDRIVRGLYFADENTGFYCGQGQMIAKTTDSGNTWNIQHFGPYWLRDLHFPSQDTGYCVGDGGNILKTIDQGNTWITLKAGPEIVQWCVNFPTKDTGYVCGNDGHMIKTTDGGNSWTQLNLFTSEELTYMYFFNTMDGYVVGDHGLIKHTVNGGLDWTDESIDVENKLKRIHFANDSLGYISGFGNVFYSTACKTPHADFVAYAVDLEVSFYQLSQLAVDYLWEFGDGTYSTEAEPVHTYPANDIYIVTLTATNECSSDQHTDTLVLAPPMMCNFSFVVEEGVVYFTDESLDAIDCYWEFGDGTSSSLSNPAHQYQNYGTYHCCLTIENDKGIFTFCDSIYYCEEAIADFEILINDGQISINDLSDKADNWMWDFGDGFTSIQENPVHQYEKSGVYNICQYASNDCSEDILCKDISIEVSAPGFSIIVSPPSSPDNLKISIPADGIYTSIIYTTLGHLYFQTEVSKKAGDVYEIDISSLPSGVYILNFRSESMQETLKFSITRL